VERASWESAAQAMRPACAAPHQMRDMRLLGQHNLDNRISRCRRDGKLMIYEEQDKVVERSRWEEAASLRGMTAGGAD
jgi:hypothetical protein